MQYGTLNEVTLIGGLKEKPTVYPVENGFAIASLKLATQYGKRQSDGSYKPATEWHDVVVKQENAELLEKYGKPGTRLFINGFLQTEREEFEDKKGEVQVRYRTRVVAKEVSFADSSNSKAKKESNEQ